MICPTCNGNKEIFGVFPPIKINCPDCEAMGTIEGDEAQILAGKNLKEVRLQQNLSLRDYCIKHNLDPVVRSKQERGIIKV